MSIRIVASPPSPPPPPRRPLRILARAAIALGAVILLLVVCYPLLERKALEAVKQKLAARGVEATWQSVSTRINGRVTLDRPHVEARGFVLDCDRIEVNLAIAASMRGTPRADVLELGTCTVERKARTDEKPAAASELAERAESLLGRPLTLLRRHFGEVRVGSLTATLQVGPGSETAEISKVRASFESGDDITGALALRGWLNAPETAFTARVNESQVDVTFANRVTFDAEQGRLEVGAVTFGDGPTLGVGDVVATSPRFPKVERIEAEWLGLHHSEAGWVIQGRGGHVQLVDEGSGEGSGAAAEPEEDVQSYKPARFRPAAPGQKAQWLPAEGPSPGQRLVARGLEGGRVFVKLIELARHDFFGAPRIEAGESRPPDLGPEGSGLVGVIPGVEPMETPRRARPPKADGASPLEASLTQAVGRARSLADRLSTALSANREPIGLEIEEMSVRRGEVELAGIRTLKLQGDGKLEARAGLGGVAVELSSDLGKDSPIELRADGLDISPLSRILPKNAEVRGRLDLRVRIAVDTQRPAITVSGTTAIHDGVLASPSVAPTALEGWSADANMAVALDLADRGSIDTRIDGHFNGVAGFARARIFPDAETHTIRASLGFSEEADCAEVWKAIPEGMLPNLGHGGVRFSGRMQPALAYVLRFNDPWSFAFDVKGFPGSCKVDWVKPGYDPMELTSPDFTFEVENYVSRGGIRVGPGTEDYVPLGAMPSYAHAIMYLSEEIGFYGNRGISVPLMNKGIRISLERGRYVYGGSTISQQLVKNLYFSRNKTLSRKLEEAVVTWRMELIVPKERILELYVNCIEFGPNVWGIRRASEYYYGKQPSALTPLEATYLAALKPSPWQGAHDMRYGHSPASGMLPMRIKELLDRLVQYGHHITTEEVYLYRPYVVALPMSPAAGGSPWKPLPRPAWALAGEPPPPGILPEGYDPARPWSGDPAPPPAPSEATPATTEPAAGAPTEPGAPAVPVPTAPPAPAPAPPPGPAATPPAPVPGGN
jgi:hypothetical protein